MKYLHNIGLHLLTGFLLTQITYQATPKHLVMEIGFVCDMEFSKLFDFDKQKITEYWSRELLTQEVNFQTLNAIQLSFKLTFVAVLKQASDQPFVESCRFSNGSTDISKLYNTFHEWAGDNSAFQQADVTVLITGSRGESTSNSIRGSVCQKYASDNKSKSIGVYRLHEKTLPSHLALGTLLGSIIGANNANCAPHTGLVADRIDFPSSHYFSNCSNEGVLNQTNFMDISCLEHLNHQEVSNVFNNVYTRQLTAVDHCRLMLGNHSIDSTEKRNGGECDSQFCLANGKRVEHVYIFYNTPCGTENFCFRGQCLSPGNLLKNTGSGMCLLTSHTLAINEQVGLQACPKYSFRFDRVLVRGSKENGVQIVATHNTLEITEKCLQLDTDSGQIVFGLCLSSNSSTWDLIFVDNAYDKFRICHHKTRNCATWNRKQSILLMSALNDKNPFQAWSLQDFNTTKESLSGQFNEANSEVANLYQPIKIVVKLLLVCDYECGKTFAFNKTTTENYWKVLIIDAHSKFQTLPRFKLTFVVAANVFIWGQEISWFTLPSEKFNKATIVNEAFGKWTYDQINVSSGFDIAILATGGKLSGTKATAVSASACQVNHTQRRFLGTITIRTDMLPSHPCDDLVHAIKIVLSATYSQKHTQDTCYSQHCRLTLGAHHYLSNCEEILLRQYILSPNASCIYKSSDFMETKLELGDGITVFPTFSQQCSLPNEPGRGQEQNCDSAKCFSKSGSSTRSIGEIYPVYKTPCGDNMVCFRGRCISQGYQLQHVLSEHCLIGTDKFATNDKLTLAQCQNIATAVYSFSFVYVSNGSFLLSTPYTTVGNQENADKCIAVSGNTEVISYKPCPKEQSSYDFEWMLEEVTGGENTYTIYHANTDKCLASNENNEIVLSLLCGRSNYAAQWKYLKNQGELLQQKPTTTVSTTSISEITEFADVKTAFVENSTKPANDFSSTAKNIILDEIPVPNEKSNDNITLENDGKDASENNTATLTTNDKNNTEGGELRIFVYASASVTTCVILTGFLCWLRHRYVRKKSEIARNMETILMQNVYAVQNSNLEDTGASQITDIPSSENNWEFPANRLKLGRLLGSGAFGSVYQAEALGILGEGQTTTVAVKTVPMVGDVAPLKALVEELKILCQLGAHLNVVNLLGACTADFAVTRKFYVIIEYCKYGNIRQYMINYRKKFVNKVQLFDDDMQATTSTADDRRSRVNSNPAENDSGESRVEAYKANLEASSFDTQDLLSWAYQIAQGMEYLTSKKILHGDLAARNILLAEHNVVKICDFGLSKKLNSAYNYNYRKRPKKELLPYKWMALESVTCGLFSTESDCWAFGVVLWELFTLGDTPYPAMQVDPEFVNKLQNGYRMSKPTYAPSIVYLLMLQCWSEDPSRRPKFTELAERLGNMLGYVVESFYVNLNLELQQERHQKFYANSNVVES